MLLRKCAYSLAVGVCTCPHFLATGFKEGYSENRWVHAVMALTQAVQILDLDLAVLAPAPFGVGGSLNLFMRTARVIVLALNTFSGMGRVDLRSAGGSQPQSLSCPPAA